MNEDSEPPAVEIKPNDDDNSGRVPFTALLIGVFWLLLPAVQYIGAAERTEDGGQSELLPGRSGSARPYSPGTSYWLAPRPSMPGSAYSTVTHGACSQLTNRSRKSLVSRTIDSKYEILERAGDGAFFKSSRRGIKPRAAWLPSSP